MPRARVWASFTTASSHPYWFVDKDGDGKVDKDDKGANVRYAAFTPKLLRAAYNYQFSVKDPGAFAHNAKYILQALYDSIEDIGGDLTGLTRPVTTREIKPDSSNPGKTTVIKSPGYLPGDFILG